MFRYDKPCIIPFSMYGIVGLLDAKGIHIFAEDDEDMVATFFFGNTECFVRSSLQVGSMGRIDEMHGAILAPGQKINNFGEDEEFFMTTEKNDTLILLLDRFSRPDIYVLRRRRFSPLLNSSNPWNIEYDRLHMDIDENASSEDTMNKRCRAFLNWELCRDLWFRRWCILNFWIKTTGEHQGCVDGPIGKRSRFEFENASELSNSITRN